MRLPWKSSIFFLSIGLELSLFVAAGSATPSGVRIWDADQVLGERAHTGEDGRLYLRDGDGVLRPFVTSTSDPAIQNPGDGRFHPLAVPPVETALDGIDPRFVGPLHFDVFILPYPVLDPLGSWAGENTIHLSPGVRALQDVQVHFVVSHEVGHMVQYAFLPDADREGWRRYRELRGIEDTLRFTARSIHRDRPHEIFAEDFRVLFGSALGRSSGPIENPDLLPPERVPGLVAFFSALVGASPAPDASPFAGLSPNPLLPGRTLQLVIRSATPDGPIDAVIFDLAGRQVRALGGLSRVGAGIFEMDWDGTDDSGRLLPSGAFFCSVRSGGRMLRIPIRLLH